MAPASWTEATWIKIVCVMGGIILVLFGAFGGQSLLGAKVQSNSEGITANAIEIEHVKETHVEKFERIEETLEKQDEKLDKIDIAVTQIQTILEQQR